MIELPDSIQALRDDETLKQGVFSLVEKLNGKKMIASDWGEARRYAEALTMAAVARGDYVVFLHDLWEEIFAGVRDIGKIEDDPSDGSPASLWDEQELAKCVALTRPVERAAEVVLYAGYDLEDGTLRLEVSAWDAKDVQVPIPDALASLDGWRLYDEYELAEPFLRSDDFPADDLPGGLERARARAAALIEACRAGSR